MIGQTPLETDATPVPRPAPAGSSVADVEQAAPEPATAPREISGRDGPEPTRYGDWEKNGRCIDF